MIMVAISISIINIVAQQLQASVFYLLRSGFGAAARLQRVVYLLRSGFGAAAGLQRVVSLLLVLVM